MARKWLFALALLTGCSHHANRVEHHWFAMDTDYNATLFERTKGSVPEDTAFAVLERESARLEKAYSDFLPGSDLNRLLGRTGDTLTIDPEMFKVFTAAQEMSVASGGRFDITLHRLKLAWGLASGDVGRIPDSAAIALVLRGNPAYGSPEDSNPALHPPYKLLDEHHLLLLRDSAVFDLGGIAKGFAVDRMHILLDSLGYPDHIVSAGGDLRLGGSKGEAPWKVGIRHPRAHDSLAGTLTFKQPFAVSTSGDYERFFIKDGARYHHIFDPRTGKPARPYCSVTVITSNSFLSDRLTKPLFLLGPARSGNLLKRFDARAVWMREIGPGALTGRSDSTDGGPHLCYESVGALDGVLSMRDVPKCSSAGSF